MPTWLPTGPVATAVGRPGCGRCNLGGPVTVILDSSRPTPDATMQIDFVHSASAVGTWTVEKEFEIATLASLVLLILDSIVVATVFSNGI